MNQPRGVEAVGDGHGLVAAVPAPVPNADASRPRLFGRGLLYVAVWSMQLLISTVVSPILAYTMGPAPFGALASGLALFQVLSVVALLGIDQALILQRTEDGDGRAARGLITVGIFVSVVVTGVFAVTIPWWDVALGFVGDRLLVITVVLWCIPAAVVQIALALLMTEDRFRAFVTISAIAAIGGQSAGVSLLIFVRADPVVYLWGCVGSQVVAMVVALAVTKPVVRGLVEWPIAWRAMRLGVPLAVGGLAYFILNAGDRIVIQRLSDAAEVGRYQVAYVVGSAVILLLTFVSAAWTPRFAEIHDEKTRWALAAASRDELYRVLMPVVLGLTAAAPMLLRIVAPASFEPDSLLVVVFLVVLAAFPFASSVLTGRLLIVARRAKTIGVIAVFVAVINIALCIAFVPPFGIAGAAAATLLAYGLMAFLQRWALPKYPRWRRPPGQLVLVVVGVAAVAGGSVALPQTAGWNMMRLGAALCCCVWFVWRLGRARGLTAAEAFAPAATVAVSGER